MINIKNIALASVVMIMIIAAFEALPEYVEVYVSYNTGKCVKVLSEHNNWSCDNLPEKYTQIMVK